MNAIGLRDIGFVVSKHVWLISLLTLAGLAAALFTDHTQRPKYQSEAKLLVRYVMESDSMDPYYSMKQPASGSYRHGDPVILTEIEIITSKDLAKEVASAVGPKRILPSTTDQLANNIDDAAEALRAELEVTNGYSPNVILIRYKSHQPDVTLTVLDHLIDSYLASHLKIHRSATSYEFIANEATDLRKKLDLSEAKLKELRTEHGFISMDEAMHELANQKRLTRQKLIETRTAHAEATARIRSIEAHNEEVGRMHASGLKNGDSKGQVPEPVRQEYQTLQSMVSLLREQTLEMRMKYSSGHPWIQMNQGRMKAHQQSIQQMQKEYPSLMLSSTSIETNTRSDNANDLAMEKINLSAEAAKVAHLESTLAWIGDEFSRLYLIGSEINRFERQRNEQETELRTLERKLKEAQIDQMLDASRIPNITLVQSPTMPVKVEDEFVQKLVIGLAAGGLAGGLAIALVIEMIFNHKIERPHVIKRQMQLPLMLSIPLIQKRSRLLEEKQNSIKRIPSSDHERTPSDDKDNTTRRAHDTETIDSDFIMPYAEAVRDRIVFSFKLNQVTHKPKILAVTGMTSRAGTSTIAYGLAKSFAQIRGIKVLLVNLSGSKNPPVGLEFSRQAINLNDALRAASDPNFRRNAKPLYHACDRVASPSGDDDVLSSLQLRELLPALQSSNYDYIIFDMPKAVETSRSLSMASLMDMVLLVLDAQNTSRSGLQWTYDELSGGRSNVSCIFNKVKTHGPSWLVDDV